MRLADLVSAARNRADVLFSFHKWIILTRVRP